MSVRRYAAPGLLLAVGGMVRVIPAPHPVVVLAEVILTIGLVWLAALAFHDLTALFDRC